jgi:hypothetical protein
MAKQVLSSDFDCCRVGAHVALYPATGRRFWFALCLTGAVFSVACAELEGTGSAPLGSQHSEQMVPSEIPDEHRRALAAWLASQPHLRLAVNSDAYGGTVEERAFTEREHEENAENELFFYVAGDLNGDGHGDFAVVVIDERNEMPPVSSLTSQRTLDEQQRKPYFSAGIAVFNGPFRVGQGPTFFEAAIGAPSGSLLWLREGSVCVGPPSSGCSMLVPGAQGYSLERGP